MSDDEWKTGERNRRDPATWTRAPSSGDRCSRTSPPRTTVGPATDPPTTPVQPRLRFGPDDTGPLPHWTAPPTGEIPSLGTPPRGPSAADDDSDDVDVDVWSTFTTESPVWRDDDPVTTVMDQVAREPDPSGATDRSGGTARRPDSSAGYDRPRSTSPGAASSTFASPTTDATPVATAHRPGRWPTREVPGRATSAARCRLERSANPVVSRSVPTRR